MDEPQETKLITDCWSANRPRPLALRCCLCPQKLAFSELVQNRVYRYMPFAASKGLFFYYALKNSSQKKLASGKVNNTSLGAEGRPTAKEAAHGEPAPELHEVHGGDRGPNSGGP
jgi:hypothetical protein